MSGTYISPATPVPGHVKITNISKNDEVFINSNSILKVLPKETSLLGANNWLCFIFYMVNSLLYGFTFIWYENSLLYGMSL